MAAVDKIYGNYLQYIQFLNWCKKNNPDALKYFYDWDQGAIRQCITNFPEEVDRWMLNNCTIKWVKEYIKEQYELDNIHDYIAFMGGDIEE